MRVLVNSREMKQCDTNTIEFFKVPSTVLMERAALSVVEEIERRGMDKSRCLVVCGSGNNGGDGLAVARLLYQRGSDVTVVCDWKTQEASEQTRQQYEIIRQYDIPVRNQIPEDDYTLIIDAIFGIGLSREVQGRRKEDIEKLNKMTGQKVAVDIPSGINADNGQMMGCAFGADLTVTFAYEKVGLFLYPGCTCAGEVVVKDIGVDCFSWLSGKPTAFAFEVSDLKLLPKRQKRSNKGTYGKVLVIAGKRNMAGAAYFSAKAAAVTGCGLVKILTAGDNRTILQQLIPEAVLDTWESTDDLPEKLESNMKWADVLVLGPGIGTEDDAQAMVEAVLKKTDKPLILDADALNILSENMELLRNHNSEVILTPHMGEMARLTKRSIQHLQQDMRGAADSIAQRYDVFCVMKDARTVTALPDGTSYINISGNDGMATAGAGDVLTGVIAGLIAQGMEPKKAAPFGVYLHGLAGDAARDETGSYSMMASDIIDGIRKVTRKE